MIYRQGKYLYNRETKERLEIPVGFTRWLSNWSLERVQRAIIAATVKAELANGDTMFYHVKIDEEGQRFVIEDQDDNIVAVRDMPYQRSPNPGLQVLMGNECNQFAFDKVHKLVANANRR